ncbi:MAG: hypothetical protein RIC55_03605 [Pirellulaceae bacterium]
MVVRPETRPSNPYLSPRVQRSAAEVPFVLRTRDGAEAHRIGKAGLYRRIRIEAPIDAVFEYRGWSLGEAIFVNDVRAIWEASWWRLIPRFDFWLNAEGEMLPTTVRIRTYPWMLLRSFRIEIDNRVVYTEGPWPDDAAPPESV